MTGMIMKAQSGFFWVKLDDTGEIIRCTLRGRLKKERLHTDIASIGDRVRVMPTVAGEGAIEEVAPRTSKLARKSPKGGGWFEHVIVANLDLVLITFAVAHPEPHVKMIDRFLVVAEYNEVGAVIIANKSDLATTEAAQAIFGIYETIGYPVIYASAVSGQGLEAIRTVLKDRISAFSGPSGVGKSSLLNALDPALQLRIGEVSDAVGKGQHTTVTARLIALPDGGYVADTPGIRELGLYAIPAEEIEWCFREFRPYLGECEFADCIHDHEPGCAIRAAVEEGAIAAARYASYLKLWAEAAAQTT